LIWSSQAKESFLFLADR